MATLVLGASKNPSRYSYKAVERLLSKGEKVILIGGRKSQLFGQDILTGTPELGDIETVTMYLSAPRQEQYEEYLIKHVKPNRIIFNPGSENLSFAIRAKAGGIQVIHACTLVLLATNQY